VSRIRVALDFNCAPRLVGALDALYGHRGFEFLHLESLVRGKTKDEIWADVYKRFGGKVVLSGDGKIATKPREAIAFIDNGFLSFFPARSFCHLAANARSAFFVHAWPLIETKISEGLHAGCWRIPCVGKKEEVFLACRPLEPMEIPNAVLEEARRRAR
jgi:hypothetical protein